MKIVVLTGAGISAESGVPTFRDGSGTWSKHNSNEVSSRGAMHRHPEKVIEFYNQRRKDLIGKKPNKAHEALVVLEKEHSVTIVTQNVDNLHELAGSSNVVHVHGHINMARNIETDETIEVHGDLDPYGVYRPDIVLFGEYPRDSNAIDAMHACDMFIVIGTSGNVFPAATYIDRVNTLGKSDTIEVNIARTPISHKFNRVICGKATEMVPKLVRELCQKS